MIKTVDIEKSFYMLGKSLSHCYDCQYCRIKSTQKDIVDYNVLPVGINKNFDVVPVAINLYYGDPFLQTEDTYNLLCRLRDTNHKGCIVIITKGDISNVEWLKNDEFKDLNLHIALSTFGMSHEYDRHSHKQFLKNLQVDIRFKKSIEFRPICFGMNDTPYVIESIFDIANQYGLPIGYSGLQGKPDTVKYWKDNDLHFEPFPLYSFGHKKSISKNVQMLFDDLSVAYNVPIFRKTSCLMSYVHNLERDYNAHYYRPNEMNCYSCRMRYKCFSFKNKLSLDKTKIEDKIPFDFEIIHKENHECILKTKGICEFPTFDCSNINGNIIKINDKLTTADVRVIKWLTGYTVDADFVESQFLSNKWLI